MIRPNRSALSGFCALVVLGLALLPAATTGQAIDLPGALQGPLEGVPEPEVVPPEERTFGTQAESAYVVHSADFEPNFDAAPWALLEAINPVTGFLVRVGTGFIIWYAPVRLPSGAEVIRLEVSACDFSTTQEVTFALLETTSPSPTGAIFTPAGHRLVTALSSTGLAANPGCQVLSAPVIVGPLTVNNANRYYAVRLNTTGSGVFFDVARVFYRLRVSPAPATATFSDVPTGHPFFQFVEALKASGITGGCQASPPLFCPDAPLTRGQMATFLSIALGLHFAP
jgi:hypothetical protein